MIAIVVGLQYGSEGKGSIVGHIAGGYRVHVRVGAANAGHTVYVNGEKHVLQQIPCAAYANPFAKLVIGAGAVISPDILMRELISNIAWREENECPPIELYVDHRAHVVTNEHVKEESAWGLSEAIGSTSSVAKEGIGAAQVARVRRRGYKTVGQLDAIRGLGSVYLCDTVQLLHDAHLMGTDILIEGTQGTGLDNVLGGQYPFVTSRHATASGILADIGFGPLHVNRIIAVARTFPIRVAGNSGPFWYDSEEIHWSDLGIDEDKERTTVTKKVRRVATFSYGQVRHAARMNSATEIALNFADYLAPEISGKAGLISARDFDQYDRLGPMVRKIERETLTPVTYVGTSPQTTLVREPDLTPAMIRAKS